jgi:iron complex outermembrane receptor protein
MGFSLSVNLRLNEWAGERSVLRNLNLQYSYIHQRRYDDVEIDDSYYGVNYLRHKVVASLTARIVPQLTATLTYRFQDRRGTFYEYDTSQETKNAYGWRTYPFLRKANYEPFSLLDLQVQWKRKRWGVYATLNNLTNVRYIDIGNVRQPGFWLTGGVKLDL